MHDLVVFAGKGCLAQIVSITEVRLASLSLSLALEGRAVSDKQVGFGQVGSSAFNLRKTLHARREARSGRARIRRLPGEGEDEEEEDRNEEGKYSRGMLKLEVSDGAQVYRVRSTPPLPTPPSSLFRFARSPALRRRKVSPFRILFFWSTAGHRV